MHKCDLSYTIPNNIECILILDKNEIFSERILTGRSALACWPCLRPGLFAWATDAPAYAGHEPETCANCHVMDSQYENWFHAPHREWANCADCHIPHDDFFSYWFYKGKSGMKDVYSFVTLGYPIAIRANEETKGIVQENCIRCHLDTVEAWLPVPCRSTATAGTATARSPTASAGFHPPYQHLEVYGK